MQQQQLQPKLLALSPATLPECVAFGLQGRPSVNTFTTLEHLHMSSKQYFGPLQLKKKKKSPDYSALPSVMMLWGPSNHFHYALHNNKNLHAVC